MSFDTALDLILDALKDSLLILPFLLLTYILIEVIQRKAKFFKDGKFLSGKNAPLLAGLSGVFPQCGFSVMSAKLYDNGFVKAGTLLAVFIATSDEAFAILVTNAKFLTLLELFTFKFALAVAVGYIFNAIIKQRTVVIKYRGTTSFKHEEYCKQCGNSQNAKNGFQAYFIYPLLHALKTFAFVLGINVVFGFVVYFIGEENIVNFMQSSKILEPLLCGLVGLIPNCASSILITQLFVRGGIKFGSMFAGLSANSGIGFAIILKNRKNLKKNLLILGILYSVSVGFGALLNFLPL